MHQERHKAEVALLKLKLVCPDAFYAVVYTGYKTGTRVDQAIIKFCGFENNAKSYKILKETAKLMEPRGEHDIWPIMNMSYSAIADLLYDLTKESK